MTKINFAAPIKDWDGEEIKVPGKAQGELVTLTLGEAARNALNFSQQGEGALSYEEAVRRGTLACQIRDAEKSMLPLDVDEKDVVLIRERMPKIYMPLVVARAAGLLKQAS